jgi:hypothetical protein
VAVAPAFGALSPRPLAGFSTSPSKVSDRALGDVRLLPAAVWVCARPARERDPVPVCPALPGDAEITPEDGGAVLVDPGLVVGALTTGVLTGAGVGAPAVEGADAALAPVVDVELPGELPLPWPLPMGLKWPWPPRKPWPKP